MRKLTTFFVLLFFIINNISAQNLEAGVFLGLSNYQGDLQSSHYVSSQNRIAYGFFGRYRLMDYLSIKGSFYKGQISGDDGRSAENSGRHDRNLSFKSDIKEFSIQGEFNPMPFIFDEPKSFAPFVFVGIAVFMHNPQTFYEGQWYDLQPLGTEGQYQENSNIKPYNLTQISIPMGMGFDFKVSDYNSIGIELGLRKTFTDYLDDVSSVYPDLDRLGESNSVAAEISYRRDEFLGQTDYENPEGLKRGTVDNKDWYMFMGMTFSFNLSELFSLGDGSDRNYRTW